MPNKTDQPFTFQVFSLTKSSGSLAVCSKGNKPNFLANDFGYPAVSPKPKTMQHTTDNCVLFFLYKKATFLKSNVAFNHCLCV